MSYFHEIENCVLKSWKVSYSFKQHDSSQHDCCLKLIYLVTKSIGTIVQCRTKKLVRPRNNYQVPNMVKKEPDGVKVIFYLVLQGNEVKRIELTVKGIWKAIKN